MLKICACGISFEIAILSSQPEASSCVEFIDIVKRYDGVSVLKGVSVNCPASQTTAIVGASGSGKTTLLQMVNGIVTPDSGVVRVFDSQVPSALRTGQQANVASSQEVQQFRRGIGYAVQGAGLFPHMTAYDNVTLVAKLQGWDEAERRTRFATLLEEMDLPESVGPRLPRELSGGQQQRLGLCRALMIRPRLLLLDEPFSAVDPITRVEIYERFQHVKRVEGVSSLLVTHDMREARRLAEYLIILHAGEIQQYGATTEVLANPANEYVRSLVESQLS